MVCEHYEFDGNQLIEYRDDLEYCEDCHAPILISCCGDELDPTPGSHGGFCPTCKEHCL